MKMAISEEDARECRLKLEEILRRHDLSWVVEQAHERIALGKTVSKQVQAGEVTVEALTGRPRRARGRTAEFLSSEPFGEAEQLNIVLEAIELSVTSPAKMQEAIFEHVGSDVGTVEFRSTTEPSPIHAIERSKLSASTATAVRVGDAVRMIRGVL